MPVVASKGTLKRFRVGDLPTVYCIQEYISKAEETSLLTEIRSAKTRWTQVSGRRLQNYGGLVTAKGLLAAKLPAWLQSLGARMAHDTAIFGDDAGSNGGSSSGSGSGSATARLPNHVLVNEYEPGEGIMAHEDGPAYFSGVCILSLGGPAVMRFFRKSSDGGKQLSVALMPRSLLVFAEDAYNECLHGIDAAEEDVLDDKVANLAASGLQPGCSLPRSCGRVSLTIRRVERVMKALRL